MDAIHYDKIADKLIQFHSKLPQEVDLEDYDARVTVARMKKQISDLLLEVDIMANRDESGWIR